MKYNDLWSDFKLYVPRPNQFRRHHRSYKVDKLVLALQFKRLFWCIVSLKAHTTKMFIRNLHIQYKALWKYFPLSLMQSVTLQFSVKLHLKLKQWSPMTYHQDSWAWGRSSSNKFGLLGEFHQRKFPGVCAVFDCTVAAHLWLSASNSLAEVLEEMSTMAMSELCKSNPTWKKEAALCWCIHQNLGMHTYEV